ncbi:MAG: N-acyl-D-glucosamine 2-epimerase, partial [Puniceicoccaceae bacterium]
MTDLTASSAPPPAPAEFAARAARELHENILPWWIEHVKDRERGGFFGRVEDDLRVDPEAERGALLSTRVLWAYSAAYRETGDAAHRVMARHALEDLRRVFWDHEHGGLFWSASAAGRVKEDRKQVYLQAFGIYGLSEYYRATGEAEALEEAKALFRVLEERARDHRHGGYFEAFARDWSPLDAEALSVMGSPTPKSQNTLLHVMEAYTNLLRAWPDPELRAAQRELIGLMLDRVYHAPGRHLHLFLDADWTPRSETVSFGHDIEFAWLVTEAAEVMGEAGLRERARAVCVEIAEAVLEGGVDDDGSVFYE